MFVRQESMNGTYCRRCPVRKANDVQLSMSPLLDTVTFDAPARLGDVIVKNVFVSGVDIIITKSFEKTN